jgi:UDP-N-acetylmuramoyl-tripeptide--D-alanyl-D-alanine ligase
MYSSDLLRAALPNAHFSGHIPDAISNITTDSRGDVKSSLFVALTGDRFDGHDYVSGAFEKGASLALVDHQHKIHYDENVNGLIGVDNTLLALQDLAHHHLRHMPACRIAITGSNGKTSTKEFIAAALREAGGAPAVLATQGNLNNHIGLPLTALRVTASHKYAVLEMGMNHHGEIAELCRIALPEIGLITNIGMAHAGNFQNVDDVGRAKSEIFQGLQENGIAIVNADDPRCLDAAKTVSAKKLFYGTTPDADVQLESIANQNPAGFTVSIRYGDQRESATLNCIGDHNAMNAVAAVAVAVAAGVDFALAVRGLGNTQPVTGRLHFVVGTNGAWILDDTYNANPESMRAGLKSLHALRAGRRMVFVAGDMLELGDRSTEVHRSIGQEAYEMGVSQIYSCGELGKNYGIGARDAGMNESNSVWCADSEELASRVASLVEPNDIILVKGSRGAKMERVVRYLTEGGI